MHLIEEYGYATVRSHRRQTLSDTGEAVRNEGLQLRLWAAELANAKAGVELFKVVIPNDQTINGQPVGDGYTRVQLHGDYVSRHSGTNSYWVALGELTAEIQAHEHSDNVEGAV